MRFESCRTTASSTASPHAVAAARLAAIALGTWRASTTQAVIGT